RAQKSVTHTCERLLVQHVYQILAGYEDCNDAQDLRHDPLFQILAGLAPDGEQPLASGSTLARFQHAFTRRQADVPAEQRTVLGEVDAALSQRLTLGNDYLLDLFVRTRRQRPAFVILDLDAWDDPTHGRQVLSGFHGYFDQHQYFPLAVYDGTTGFPLAVWLRPGRVHASTGAVDVLRRLVTRLRAAWPDVLLLVRGDDGFAVPDMYDYCEREGLLYAFGYASNAVLGARTEAWLADLQEYYHWYGARGQAQGRPAGVGRARDAVHVHGDHIEVVVIDAATDAVAGVGGVGVAVRRRQQCVAHEREGGDDNRRPANECHAY